MKSFFRSFPYSTFLISILCMGLGLSMLLWPDHAMTVMCYGFGGVLILAGMILGITLQTAPEDIYRAIAEAVVCGARTILDHFRDSGVEIRKLLVTGGISRKNPMMMQMYADMLNMPVYVPKTFEGSASGAAMTAAAAAEAGKAGGRSVREIIRDMAPKENTVYLPDPGKREGYDRLFRLYTEMSQAMAREDSVMKRLLAFRQSL